MRENKPKRIDRKTISHVINQDGAVKGRTSCNPGLVFGSRSNPVKFTRTPSPDLESNQSKPPNVSKRVKNDVVRDQKPTLNGAVDNRASLGQTRRHTKKTRLKKSEKDSQILVQDAWIIRNGHSLTYAGLFLFTFVLYFRPYEQISSLAGFDSLALIVAIATLVVYLPTQFYVEGRLTVLTTEIKCVLFLAFWALLTIPIAKSSGLAWETFADIFSKVVLIFIIMVNILRTELRLKGLIWLSIGVGVLLSFQAIDLYQKGVFNTEGYRVSVDFGGMFGNPNDMAMHLVIFTPIAVALGVASRKKLVKLAYFFSAGMMIAGNMVTQSRGGFLGLLAMSSVLAWKLGKNQRFKVVLISIIVGLLVMAFAPGNYGLRVMSIFVPSLDPVGSSDQRTELLVQSIWVTLRNPFGIGIGNFPIVGIYNRETHNAYTQVSAELGWFAFAAYLILLISPWRKLGTIERQLFSRGDHTWIYYLSIGIQASIAGYMVSSFFGSVAFQWYIYYPIAYAICLRRIYQNGQVETSDSPESGLNKRFIPRGA